MKMKNEVVLVTGANRGLGRSLVKRLLAAGAKRIYATARNPEQLADLVVEGQGRVIPLALDVTNAASIAAAAAKASDLTVLVNNAGVVASHGILASSEQALAQDFATNLFGSLAVTKAFLPALERAAARGPEPSAAIVNVLSVVSLANMPALGGYSASKAASLSVTQALRFDLAKTKIAVHAVLPGPIDTEMTRGMDMPKTSPEAVANAIVLGVEQGTEDIAPDPMAVDLLGQWKKDPKAVERVFATMSGG